MVYGHLKKNCQYKMSKIEKIIIGTNNSGKYKEISDLLPTTVIKHSAKEFNILTPEETGKSFKENSIIKASYFAKKTNLICLSDDSGLEINILKGEPGIYSSRWSGPKNDFNLAIEKLYSKDFQDILKLTKNPYGHGNASSKIIKILKNELPPKDVKKLFYDL